MKNRLALVVVLLITVAAVAVQTTRTVQKQAVPQSLAAYVPQDALLSIESPDFASLLHQWENSAQCAAWLKSENYSVFQNSHLFGRLMEAQANFADVAKVRGGTVFLNQVAGSRSVFAWYDVGNLEFLYITRMSSQQAAQTQLLQARGSFSRRHAGNADFYVRTGGTPVHTVAFAQVASPAGDLLLLATREDLMANALELIAGKQAASIEQEPWFDDAQKALPAEKIAPALHMVLNLDRIVPMPHFRSYWVQQNVTWMGRFRAASADLYPEANRFREERVLLPKSSADTAPDTPALAALTGLIPPGTGVYRAAATTDPADAIRALNEKVLGNYKAEKPRDRYADDPDLTAPQSGSANDLETRIDTPTPVSLSASTETLAATLRTAHLDAILTLSSARMPSAAEGLWVPLHSAVVLHTGQPIAPEALSAALQQALRGSLTAATIGIDFHATTVAGRTLYAMSGPRPLFFAAGGIGDTVLIADDQTLLMALLSQTPQAVEDAPASLIAGFDHSSQRAPFARLTSLIDGSNTASDVQTAQTPAVARASGAPAFFSQNLRSLSDSLATLQSERVVERTVDRKLRQTVTYVWQNP